MQEKILKLLIVSQYYFPEQFRINEISVELARRGHQVTVLTGQPNYPEGNIYKGYEKIHDNEKYNGVNVIRCKNLPRKRGNLHLGLNYLSYMINASKAIMKIKDKYDIVFVYQLSPILIAIPAIRYVRRNKTPLVFYTLDIWPESVKDVFSIEESLLYKTIRKVSEHIYQKADLIIVTSRPFIDYLETVCGVDRSRISYIPQHAEDMNQVNDLSTISNGVIDFVFMGNVGHSQDLFNVVKAVSQIDSSLPFMVHIVGDGSELDNVKEYTKAMNVENKFCFYGRHPIEDMPKYYQLADVCLLSLLDEGIIGKTIPGKLQGYMSAGKPVVAAINGPASEIINEARCGISVPAGDSKRLAMVMESICNNSECLSTYGKNARDYYLKHFTLKKYTDSLLDCFRQVIMK